MNESVLRFFWRALPILLGALLLVGGAYVLLHAAGVAAPIRFGHLPGEAEPGSPFLLFLDLQALPLKFGLLWMLAGAGAVLLGGALAALGLARVRGEGQQIVLRGRDGSALYGGGRVTVSLKSLLALITNVAERTNGVREARPRLRLRRSGWHLDCIVSISPAVPIPDVARSLAPRLQEALEHHTGLPVAHVNINGQLGLVGAERRVK